MCDLESGWLNSTGDPNCPPLTTRECDFSVLVGDKKAELIRDVDEKQMDSALRRLKFCLDCWCWSCCRRAAPKHEVMVTWSPLCSREE